MTRSLILWLLLTSCAWAGADFSFDLTSNGNDNWIVVPSASDDIPQCDLLSTFTLSHWTTPGVDGVDETIFTRSLGNLNRNYRSLNTAADTWSDDASSGGVFGDGYLAGGGAGLAGVASHVASVFDAAVSAILYIDGVATTTDATVAVPDDPVAGIRIGGQSTTTSTQHAAATDHRGSSESIAIYAVVLEPGEVAQLALRNSFRRPIRDRVFWMPLLGVPGVDLDNAVKDLSPFKVNGDGTPGTNPTYIPSYTRGAGR